MAEPGSRGLPNGSSEPLPFDLVTLGAAALVRPDGSLVLDRSKQLALLTYLHAAPRRTVRREQLCALLWGDSGPDAAARAFRSTLSRMRAAVGETADSSNAEVTLRAAITSDRDQFLAAIEAGNLESAVALYTGPFFPAYSDTGSAEFEEWVELERARLQELFIRSADALVRRLLEQGRNRDGVELARRVRSMAPEAEAGWRLLLESLVVAHEDLAARAEAEGLTIWLNQRDREPEHRTAMLLKLVRDGGAAVEAGSPGTTFFSELVGREQEYSAIMQAWGHASRSNPRHIHLSANAGLGKTRLLSEIAGRIRSLGGCVVSVRATAGERHIEYALAAELARALGYAPGAAGIAPSFTPILVQLQPALAFHYPAAIPTRSDRDLTLQRSQALGELVGAIADNAPLALIIDDLHWADGESLRILTSLSERLDKRRVLLLTAGRPPDAGHSVLTQTTQLPALSTADVERLLASLGNPPTQECADRLARVLHQATSGVPLLILETLLLARERGDFVLSHGSWSAKDFDRLLERIGAIKGLLTRLSSLKGTARRTLLLLAAAGTAIPESALRHMVAVHLGEDALDALDRAGYLIRRDGGVELAHDEIARACDQLATPEEQKEVHRVLGEWLAATARHDRRGLSRAGRHFRLADYADGSASVFRRWVQLSRETGTRLSATALAREFQGEEDIGSSMLVRSLPLTLRYPYARRFGLASSVAVVGTIVAMALARASAVPADAKLMVITPVLGDSAADGYQVPVSLRDWPLGTTLSLGRKARLQKWPGVIVSHPDFYHDRMLYSVKVPDSGITDVFLREATGTTRRLTVSAGDDVSPSWSPDGTQIAFQTDRFTPRGDKDSDIAVMDLATGWVRQLTNGTDYDAVPKWSPDGTRIAFHRTRALDGKGIICWVSADANVSRCPISAGGVPQQPIGWSDPNNMILVTKSADDQFDLVEMSLSNGKLRSLELPGVIGGSVDQTGQWLAVNQKRIGDSLQQTIVLPLKEPSRRRPLGATRSREGPVLGWVNASESFINDWTLRITAPDTGIPGMTHHMTAIALDTSGRSREIAWETLRWASRDTTIVSIDAESGILIPRREGTTWVIASAGGWRLDSLRFHVVQGFHQRVFQEEWRDSTMPGWVRFGTPQPTVRWGAGGRPAFLNNGDNAWDSGAITREGFVGRQGLGLETTLIVPVTRPKWQTIRITLGRLLEIKSDGVSIEGCGFALPSGEGVTRMKELALSALPEVVLRDAPPDLADGQPHRLRMQVFPDRTCGIAVDEQALWRSSRPMIVDYPFQLTLFGRSVGADLLVGPIEVWQGVKSGIDWRILQAQPKQ